MGLGTEIAGRTKRECLKAQPTALQSSAELLRLPLFSLESSHACLQLAPVIEGNARNAGNALLVMALLLLILESCSADESLGSDWRDAGSADSKPK